MAVDYHVTYVDTRPDIQASSGRLVYVKEVHFVIDTSPAMGHEDSVTLPEDRFNADNAKALIEDKVARVKATFAL